MDQAVGRFAESEDQRPALFKSHGARAVEAAADRLENGRTTAEEFVLTPHLVVRGSTAAARDQAERP